MVQTVDGEENGGPTAPFHAQSPKAEFGFGFFGGGEQEPRGQYDGEGSELSDRGVIGS